MAALSVDTGKVLATVTLQAEIADLYELSSGLFGFTLKMATAPLAGEMRRG